MHHISAKQRYISFGVRLRGSLQWADPSERIHSSLRDRPKVSFTEELQTQRAVQGFNLMQWDIYQGKGCTGPDSEHQKLRVWLRTDEGNKWGNKIYLPTNHSCEGHLIFCLGGLGFGKTGLPFPIICALPIWGYQRGIPAETKCIIRFMI